MGEPGWERGLERARQGVNYGGLETEFDRMKEGVRQDREGVRQVREGLDEGRQG